MRRLFTCLALGVSAPALACINDSELPSHEREFRSSYQADRKPGDPAPSALQQYGPLTAAGVGVLLPAGAAVLTTRRMTAKG